MFKQQIKPLHYVFHNILPNQLNLYFYIAKKLFHPR